MKRSTLTPRELADVVGVSESSIKRWVDDGLMDVTRTAGGHRRILLQEAVRFIRQREMRVLRPELLGVPGVMNLTAEAQRGEATGDVLYHLLRRGEAAKARSLIANEYLNGASLASLFDGPMVEALVQIGELWDHGDEGIYVEHVATSIAIETINQLRTLVPPPAADAPKALGGAPPGDPYILPSLMAAAVVADAGYVEINIGPNTPYAAFLHAADIEHPALIWLALTASLSAEEAEALTEQLLRPLGDRDVELVLGGRQALAHADRWPAHAHVMASMEELATHAAARRDA